MNIDPILSYPRVSGNRGLSRHSNYPIPNPRHGIVERVMFHQPRIPPRGMRSFPHRFRVHPGRVLIRSQVSSRTYTPRDRRCTLTWLSFVSPPFILPLRNTPRCFRFYTSLHLLLSPAMLSSSGNNAYVPGIPCIAGRLDSCSRNYFSAPPGGKGAIS